MHSRCSRLFEIAEILPGTFAKNVIEDGLYRHAFSVTIWKGSINALLISLNSEDGCRRNFKARKVIHNGEFQTLSFLSKVSMICCLLLWERCAVMSTKGAIDVRRPHL